MKTLAVISLILSLAVVTLFYGCMDRGIRKTPITGSGLNMDGTPTCTGE